MASKVRLVSGAVALMLGCGLFAGSSVAWAAAPANDNFADAMPLVGPAGTLSGSTVEATSEGAAGEPCEFNCSPTVWFVWTLPSSTRNTVTFSLCGSTFDTSLSVYTGATFGEMSTAAQSDDFCGKASQVTFLALPGVVYSVRVGGTGMGISGNFTFAYPAGGPLPSAGAPDGDGDGITDAQDPDVVAAIVADPAIAIGAGNRKATLERLSYVESLIVQGDVPAALTELSNLRKRVDGCGAKADKNDWIDNCGNQLSVRSALDNLAAALRG